MITTVTHEIRGRKSPYTGQVPVRTVEYTQIEGVVTAVQEPTHSNVIVGGGSTGVHHHRRRRERPGRPRRAQRARVIAETTSSGHYSRLREVEIL